MMIFKAVKRFILLLLFFDISLTLFAQTDSLEVQLQEFTVESSRSNTRIENLPASVQIVSKEKIQGAQATISLEESLRSVPGVFVNNRYNLAQGDRITIRGIGSRSQFGVRGIKMVLDGIPLTFPDGQSQLNNIDVASLGRIEVLKGPSSVLYGNSSGGVIYLETERPSEAKLQITPSYWIGSYGLNKAQIRISGKVDRFTYIINSNRTEFEGYRNFSSGLFYNVNSNVKYQINDKSNVRLIVNGNDSPYLLNPGSLDKKTSDEDPTFSRKFNQLQGAGKKTRQIQGGVGYDLALKRGQKIDLIAYAITRDLYNPIPGRIVDLNRKTIGLRGTYNKHLNLFTTRMNIAAGYDYEFQIDERSEFQNQGISETQFASLKNASIINTAKKGSLLVKQDESVTGNGVFSKIDWKIRRVTITGGLRFDNYHFKVEDLFLQDNANNSGSQNLQQLNPSVGAVYRLAKEINIYSNYSSAFQTPSANEFGNLPSGVGGFNKSLKPEKIKSVEAGVRGKFWNNKISYDFAFFHLNIQDQLIGYQTEDQTSDEVFYRNAGKTKNIGVESFISINPVKNIFLDLAYTTNNFRFVDYAVENGEDKIQLKDNKVPGVPSGRFFTSLRYVADQGLSVDLNFQQIGKVYVNDFNGNSDGSDSGNFINKSYSLLDLRLSYQKTIGILMPKIFGGINNILDQKYNGSIVPNAAGARFFEPAPGANWYVGISFPINAVK